jgi:hypothetical protein
VSQLVYVALVRPGGPERNRKDQQNICILPMILPNHLEAKQLLLAEVSKRRYDPAVCDELTKYLFTKRLHAALLGPPDPANATSEVSWKEHCKGS